MGEATPELVEAVRRSWRFIRWDAGGFLTSHEGDASKLFYGRIQPGFFADIARALRFLASGTLRSLREGVGVLVRGPLRPAGMTEPYMLLITVGGPKYAQEEAVLRAACADRGLSVRMAHGMARPEARQLGPCFDVGISLGLGEHLRVFLRWWLEVARGARFFFSSDARGRRLFVASIPMIRDHFLYRALGRLILSSPEAPQFALTLLPSLAGSVTLIDCLKAAGVRTAGLRSQLTAREIEHIAANTDELFCKCNFEQNFYSELFSKGGPSLRQGCILSIPASGQLPPLSLPQKYALILGTAPFRDQHGDDYMRYVAKCFAAAKASGLPIVYKGHNLARRYDDLWFAEHSGTADDCIRIDDIRRNRELIDGATLIVSAPTTLIYYAIMVGCPVVIVDFPGVPTATSELASSPIHCISADTEIPPGLSLDVLQRAVASTREWFRCNYYLDKGPAHIVGCMLSAGSRRRQEGGAPDRQCDEAAIRGQV